MHLRPTPLVMGIVNVTPDSFSDGGRFLDPHAAIAHGLALSSEGADILDVGGESTRPGSAPVSAQEELARVLPVIRALAGRCHAVISVDTTKPEVAREAAKVGAKIINDVSMLRDGPALAEVAAETGAELVLMHSRGTPADMQDDIRYGDVVEDVARELLEAAGRAEAAGVDASRVWIDPGLGFAKTVEHNLELLARLPELAALGYRVLVGPSRKSFIGALTGAPVNDRLGGSAAAVALAVMGGAAAVRVHDVAIMRQAAIVAHAVARRADG
ncbi:MAG: dihydropteroate synthase [Deltaproteobacteria bacterium]|nr:dihydropteroate synthase [Deltaproteobacteria bacterium]